MITNLKEYMYDGFKLPYGVYKGAIVFNLKGLADIININKPFNLIDVNNTKHVLKLNKDNFSNNRLSAYNKPIDQRKEYFLTEEGAKVFLLKANKIYAKEIYTWICTILPKIKDQLQKEPMFRNEREDKNAVNTKLDDKSTNLVLINNTQVAFNEHEGNIYVSSRDVAKVFEKDHYNILRDINNLPEDDFRAFNFEGSSYISNQGKSLPEYHLTRDGFSMLVMGFTGQKAYEWKKSFIQAFNRMEQALRYGNTSLNNSVSTLQLQLNIEETKLKQEELKLEQERLKLEQLKLNYNLR